MFITTQWAITSGCGQAAVATDAPSIRTAALVATTEAVNDFAWETVANSATPIPGMGAQTFLSFGQPAVSGDGVIVFRGRGRGGEGATAGQPVRGVFGQDRGSSTTPGALVAVALTGLEVPAPNNTDARFNEFPAVPRISLRGATTATRGQSRPVWEYPLDPLETTTTRVGTAGVYVQRKGALATAVGLLGAVRDPGDGSPVFPWFAVPGLEYAQRFDQFPGAPAVDGDVVAFKGNWTDADGSARTGVYARMLGDDEAPVVRVADNLSTAIPGGSAPFGSTAPPSVAGDTVVFVGVDVEEAPTVGGIYRARPFDTSDLQALVKIGGRVPDERGRPTADRFARFGEALSFDGRFVSFWAAWFDVAASDEQNWRTVTLTCPTDGNPALLEACRQASAGGTGTTEVRVPRHQGFFVHDIRRGRTFRVAQTNDDFTDFLFWTYSGRPPGVGGDESDDGELEPPRWRSSAFGAVRGGGSAELVFKALAAGDEQALVLARRVGQPNRSLTTLLRTGTAADLLDDAAPPTVAIVGLGLERDGFRDGDGVDDEDGDDDGDDAEKEVFLAVTASMASEDGAVVWAGVYLARWPSDEEDD